jgi:ATP-dependent DNA helicase RecG
MTKEELKKLIDQSEGHNLELKKSTSLRQEIGQAVSAFANTDGGVILVGISPDGEIVGVDIGKKTLEDLANTIKENTDPKIYPQMKIHNVDGKNVIEIIVKEADEKPVFFSSRAYQRVGRTSPMISVSKIRELVKQDRKTLSWDEKIYDEVTMESIDEARVRWFVKEAKKQRTLKIPENASLGEILRKLKLMKNEQLTNTAILLFAKESHFLQSEVKGIRFSSDKPVKPYIDFVSIEGNIFDLVDNAQDFVLRNIRKSIWLNSGKVQREEKYEYPPDAIREAIVNAIAHRDYESPSKVQVRIFDNRIEIWNPGLLPKEITIEDLKIEHRSIPRNPLLFKQLFWVKYVEDVGGGTLDMVEQCKEWGLPEPEFKQISGAFVVVFKLPPNIENLEKLGLNERQIKAIQYIREKGMITNREYQKLCATSWDTAYRDLSELVQKSILKREGKGRSTHYLMII